MNIDESPLCYFCSGENPGHNYHKDKEHIFIGNQLHNPTFVHTGNSFLFESQLFIGIVHLKRNAISFQISKYWVQNVLITMNICNNMIYNIHENTLFNYENKAVGHAPGAPLMYFDGGGGGEDRGSILYPKKNPSFKICLPKKFPTFFLAYPKHSHTSSKLHLGHCWFELMKSTIPKNSLCFFCTPKKIPASFIDPKRTLLAKISDPKKSLRPPISKICEWGPWGSCKAKYL